MDATTLTAYRKRLQAELADVVRRVVAMEDELEAMADELDVEIMDRVQEEAWAGLLARLDEQDRAQAEEIQAALDRIESGTFGRCALCHGEIEPARLEAVPAARRCAACEEALDASSGRP